MSTHAVGSEGAERWRDRIVALDKRYLWHPYTAMSTYIAEVDPLVIVRAEGSRLFDANGRSYLDGNSSWWVAALGHGHPRLIAALEKQARTLAHCSLAGTTHEPAARLAEELVQLAPAGLTRVFYTDDGSTALEVAVKICVQAWAQLGAPKKRRFVALDGAFHGDTLAPTSLGGVEVFRRPFADLLFDCVHAPFPEPSAYERAFDTMATLLRRESDAIAAVVVEPMVQGAAGMRTYAPEFLRELRALCTERDVLLVADEVFTGYGRTGAMWAVEHAGVAPDVLCVGKAFAAIVPMAATLVSERIFDAFRGGKERALYYGHTFCGNPIGAALALEVLAIYRDEGIVGATRPKAARIAEAFARIGELPGVARVRSLGMVGAADLEVRGGASGYLGDVGWRVYAEGLKRGAYLRPLGNTVYVCPPLNIADAELGVLLAILEESVRAALAA